MNRNELAVVVPTNRPEAIETWYKAWGPVLKGKAEIFIVWDMPSIAVPGLCGVYNLAWEDGIPYGKMISNCHHSSSMRNLGFLKAAEMGFKYIATLDDDTLPIDALWPDRMVHNLSCIVDPYTFYPVPFRTRGCPSELLQAPVLLHHGVWEGVPDVYGKDQIIYHITDGQPHPVVAVPNGQLFPMSGMNVAFRTELLPAMYFWPQHKYQRYDDIWCGLFAKKVIDLVGGAATSGAPAIFHARLSNREKSEKLEQKGEKINNALWKRMLDMPGPIDVHKMNISEIALYVAGFMPKEIKETGSSIINWVNIVNKIGR